MKKILFFACILFSSLYGIGQPDTTSAKHTDTLINPVIVVGTKIDTSIKKVDTAFKTKAQPVTTNPVTKIATSQPAKKPELFNSGFIDFQNSGQMNASARVFKIYIGEPKKFMLPLSIYSGVSGNNYNTNAASAASGAGGQQMVMGLINPMSGCLIFQQIIRFALPKKVKTLPTGRQVLQVFHLFTS